jgi:3-hydroxymyristoyl/3-hydroxydecanoyl-(acyl carrier protein) dehydratase
MFPELLAVEAMAQAAAAFHGLRLGSGGSAAAEERGTLASVDRARFNGRIRPGDAITVKIKQKRIWGELVMLDGEVWVHHRMVAQAELVVRRGPP